MNFKSEELPKGRWCGGEELPPGGWRGGEELPPGGWRAVEDVYRTKDGNGTYTFRFYQVGNHYEADIASMPHYGSRATELHSTHRLPSERGGYRICLGDDSQMSSLGQARRWAAAWAENTQRYIKTGIGF